eukprot:CAMPEP_0174722080 /NCGR_PEP_ID=MMETSP1094-20130205/37608_1 /TAXON_ID=156173 /ORGANISM="Chrysochromulina brevifilum, Strain UTEX LB 985" /LENGTH=99 /DNA_ID=CAMNT_0015922867 /DNA_START=251 /DNA_END=547 /DNA_ORIENTATION=-
MSIILSWRFPYRVEFTRPGRVRASVNLLEVHGSVAPAAERLVRIERRVGPQLPVPSGCRAAIEIESDEADIPEDVAGSSAAALTRAVTCRRVEQWRRLT